MKRRIGTFLIGIVVGMVILGPAANAAEEYFKAYRSSQNIYLDGQQIELDAYVIQGNNYVKLRDIAQAIDFNVYWDGSVQVDSNSPYTGEAPKDSNAVIIPSDGSRYEPKAGDVIQCDDGSLYTITDVSLWDNSMFASGPLPDLPEANCDWTSFPTVELPSAEARHFNLTSGNYLFVRNLYETRRMQYTIQNLAGNHPDTSSNGSLKYSAKGTPSVRIKLTIDDDLSPQSFWPWRESELEKVFNSCPPGTYSIEAWDVYKDGKFIRTEYKIHAI